MPNTKQGFGLTGILVVIVIILSAGTTSLYVVKNTDFVTKDTSDDEISFISTEEENSKSPQLTVPDTSTISSDRFENNDSDLDKTISFTSGGNNKDLPNIYGKTVITYDVNEVPNDGSGYVYITGTDESRKIDITINGSSNFSPIEFLSPFTFSWNVENVTGCSVGGGDVVSENYKPKLGKYYDEGFIKVDNSGSIRLKGFRVDYEPVLRVSVNCLNPKDSMRNVNIYVGVPVVQPGPLEAVFVYPKEGDVIARLVDNSVKWKIVDGSKDVIISTVDFVVRRASDGEIIHSRADRTISHIPDPDYLSGIVSHKWLYDVPKGEYYLEIEKINNTPTNVKSGIFKVENSATSEISIAYPNGGEKLYSKNQYQIRWSPINAQDIFNYTKIYLEKMKNGRFINVGELIMSGDPISAYIENGFNWDGEIDKQDNYVEPGNYYIRVVNTATGAEDRSDNSFNVVDNPVKASLKINGSSGPIYVSSEEESLIASWESTNADNCLLLSNPWGSSGTTSNPPAGQRVITLRAYDTPYFVYIKCSSNDLQIKTLDAVEVIAK